MTFRSQSQLFTLKDAVAVLQYARQPGNQHVLKSLQVIEQIFRKYQNNALQLCLSFNGGKDCTVLIHLISAYMKGSHLNGKEDEDDAINQSIKIEKPKNGKTTNTTSKTDNVNDHPHRRRNCWSTMQSICNGANNTHQADTLSPVTITMHSHAAIPQTNHINSSNKERRLLTLYIRPRDPFPETEEFIQQAKQRYDLDLITLEGEDDLKASLQSFKNCSKGSSVQAIFMGQRSTDCPGLIDFTQRTDQDWPAFLRVNPLLHWSYHQIWNFIRDLKVPYCSLYDQGYSSLGSRANTRPNIKLTLRNEDGSTTYLAADLLPDAKFERLTRKSDS